LSQSRLTSTCCLDVSPLDELQLEEFLEEPARGVETPCQQPRPATPTRSPLQDMTFGGHIFSDEVPKIWTYLQEKGRVQPDPA